MLAPRRHLVANPTFVAMAPQAPAYINMCFWLAMFPIVLLLTHRFLIAFFGAIAAGVIIHMLLVRYGQREPCFGGQLYANLIRYAPLLTGRRPWARLGTDPDWIEFDPS